jgi:hypothetical protein
LPKINRPLPLPLSFRRRGELFINLFFLTPSSPEEGEEGWGGEVSRVAKNNSTGNMIALYRSVLMD